MGENFQSLKCLPLYEFHQKAGARFGSFAGWNMPLTYPMGVMKEHLHTRAKAGLFDISHMKLIAIEGHEAERFLSFALPIAADQMAIQQARYNYLLDERAGILDDLIVTRLSEARFMMVANAGNWEADVAYLRERASGFSCEIIPLERVILALQGPLTPEILARVGFGGGALRFMQGYEPKPGWFISRSGYTGEDGFEISVPFDEGAMVAETLLREKEVAWIGLAARDSLRLEAGLCLHGADISCDTTPIEAGLGWAVPKAVREAGVFYGADAYRQAVKATPVRRRVGLKPETRQPVRAGAKLFDKAGELVGEVTSGGFGPSFGGPVAMGYVAIDYAGIGTKLYAEVRGKTVVVSVHGLPFVEQRYFKG
ncbi:glycine cleavage system aminomethyltransferase GcvT [Bartonella sp. DGB2]|uniref:glycine cleavage system aminomethyltransferase GcvT n=1 Tax=Bartonella sp. DGB2 TaxID=3388426 RepID=UPI0039901258